MKQTPYLVLLLCCLTGSANAFDHRHTAWDRLLHQHVQLDQLGTASRVDYAGIRNQHERLTAYLSNLSGVQEAEFRGWTAQQRLAFLINAYNAFTVELVLRHYPGLSSIKDIGGWFESPWRERFFRLLGKHRSLDDIEHGMIRPRGLFDEPRIHVALVCASVGCPMLRNEAYVGGQLDRQLEDGMLAFLSDRERTRFDTKSGTLAISKLFDWYGDDFTASGNYPSLRAVLARYATQFTDSVEVQEQIRSGNFTIRFLKYDWSLNDVVKPAMMGLNRDRHSEG